MGSGRSSWGEAGSRDSTLRAWSARSEGEALQRSLFGLGGFGVDGRPSPTHGLTRRAKRRLVAWWWLARGWVGDRLVSAGHRIAGTANEPWCCCGMCDD